MFTFAITTRWSSACAVFLIILLGHPAAATAQQHELNQRQPDFVQDVLPILRRNCFRCHGTKNQEADLQLNLRASAIQESLVVRHDPDASTLIHRITDPSFGDLMPLDSEPLAPAEIAVLRSWIRSGADWPDAVAEPKHWAYQPIRRPAIPETSDQEPPDAAPLAIDAFIHKGLATKGLSFNDEVDRARLIRRVSLALTGIPPSPQEVTEFENDSAANAYELLVDRLLSSPRYGERWAVPWLDLARYADSNGFQADQIRDNWAYRDWVIRSMNADQPFDQFVIDQLAGDLIPGGTSDQKIATGFHRMTTCNVEAGVHPEANRVNQIVDRVNTTATVFLGTTLECSQCHDHKYDPFSQEDYYRLFAYFNNTPLEVKNTSGVTWDFYGPMMDLPMDNSKQSRLAELKQQLEAQKKKLKQTNEASQEAFEQWLDKVQALVAEAQDWEVLTPDAFETSGGEEFLIQEDGSVLLSGTVPDTVEHTFTLNITGKPVTAIRVEALTDPSIPGRGPGRGDAKRTNFILSEITAAATTDKEAWQLHFDEATADFSQANWPVANAIDGKPNTGWAISPQFGKEHWAAFVLAEPLESDAAQGLKVTLVQNYGRGRVLGKPRISIYSGSPELLTLDDSLTKLVRKSNRSAKDNKKLRDHFDTRNPELKKVKQAIAKLEQQVQVLKPDTTLVMVELDKPRETHIMIRGEYEQLGKKVSAGTPDVLPKLEASKRGDRLELAQWLTSRENPLLARVTVNRWWAEIFGRGLVATPEDFGTQGESPTHPELLDWLAAEFMEAGWSMKHMHKLMVMSEAFQRSARAAQDQRAMDPENVWLARGPRFRMTAELLRDNALAISGLLSEGMYGPPIMPYQPDNIWRSVGRNQPKWKAAEDHNRFRRGLYIVWKRAAPYPSFTNFDAPNRGSCTVVRSRSNTPLQALTMLNDPAYTEMALALADRVLTESPESSDEARLDYAMRLAVSRTAYSREIDVLSQLLTAERELLAREPDLVKSRTRVPFDGLTPTYDNRQELAAWLPVANAILNLDETMTQ